MKGNTTITLNQASMIEAVQKYIDGQLTSNGGFGIVKGVSPATKSYGGAQSFTVELEKPDAVMLKAAPQPAKENDHD